MVKPSQERETRALTLTQSVAMGDGTAVGEDGVDFDTGTNPDTGVITPPAGEPVEFLSAASGDIVLDFTTARWYDITLAGNVTSTTIINPPAAGLLGQMHVTVRQPASGGPYTYAHPTLADWRDTDGTGGGSPPALSTAAEAQDNYVYDTRDGGVSYGGSYDSVGSSVDPDVEVVAASGSAQTIDADTSLDWSITLTANCAIDFDGWIADKRRSVAVKYIQDGTGGWTLTHDAAGILPGGIEPTIDPTPGNETWLLYVFDEDGTTVRVFPTNGTAASGGTDIEVLNEGVTLTSEAVSFDFVGAGVNATESSDAVTVTIPGGATASDTHAWMPLTTVVGGEPELVWDGDDSLIPTYVPI